MAVAIKPTLDIEIGAVALDPRHGLAMVPVRSVGRDDFDVVVEFDGRSVYVAEAAAVLEDELARALDAADGEPFVAVVGEIRVENELADDVLLSDVKRDCIVECRRVVGSLRIGIGRRAIDSPVGRISPSIILRAARP